MKHILIFSLTILVSLIIYGILEFKTDNNKLLVLRTAPVLEHAEMGVATSSIESASDKSLLRKTLSDKQNSKVLSYKGAHADGTLETDVNGNLIITKRLKDLFNYFLSSYGERSIESIKESIRNHIDQNLSEPARSQALQVLKTYLNYKNALVELEIQLGSENTEILDSKDIEFLRERLAEIRAIRRDFFSDNVADAFFLDSERYDQYTLQRMEINHNKSLGHDEKNTALEQTELLLPEEARQLKERSTKHLSLKAKQLAMIDASSEDIHNMRTKEVGVEAANRLSELDNERAQWKQQLHHYQLEKSIISYSGLSQEDKKEAIQQLQKRMFDSNQIKRVLVLERVSQNI